MTEDLLDESYQLVSNLNDLSWHSAYHQNHLKYAKVIRILDKAHNRYQRRWNAYQGTKCKENTFN